MQLSLFGDDTGDQSQCQHPQVLGETGYRYGCRCARCCEAHARWKHPTSQCAADDCTAPRLKHRRWCVEHVPRPRPSQIRAEADCQLCSRHHSWYESVLEHNMRPEIRDLYRRTCSGCRRQYIGAIKQHRLDTVTALRLITAVECELCHERFATDRRGRRYSVVDHDHDHCPGHHSCGTCVRGIICPRCNMDVGALERVERTVGIDKLAAYLARHRRP